MRGGGGVCGVVMDKIPHWLQNAACGEMGILNTPPPEASPNSILQKKKKKKKYTHTHTHAHARTHTHTHTRTHTQTHTPISELLAVKYHRAKKKKRKRKKKKIVIQMRCVYFCMAFEERRGVVSLKRRKGPLRYTPLLFALPLSHPSLPLFFFSRSDRPPLTLPPPHTRVHARTFSL